MNTQTDSLIETWRQEAETTEQMMADKYPGELQSWEDGEDYYAMESRAETLRTCAAELEAAMSGDLDVESSASRQHRIDTGRYLTYSEQRVE